MGGREGPPQLENRAPWRAKPILVSGASAYRNGEFVYQDFLFDNRGAAPAMPSPGEETETGNRRAAGESRHRV